MAHRLVGFGTCLAMVWALLMGPFQHVHERHDAHHGSEGHDELPLVHTHPYGISFSAGPDGQRRIQDSHGSHAAWSLDTFTVILDAPQFLFLPTESKVRSAVPAESFFTAELTEARSHDPPTLSHLFPRAPPV
jgi:hypothetical protein